MTRFSPGFIQAAVNSAVSSLDTIGLIVQGADLTTGSLAVSAGTNRLLIVITGWEHSVIRTADSVAYGGQSMTLAKAEGAGATNSVGISLWYLNDAGIAAASGTAIVPTFSGSITDGVLFAGSLQNVSDQSTPVGNSGSNTTTSAHSELATVINDVDEGFTIGAGYVNANATIVMVNVTDFPDSEVQEPSSTLVAGGIATTGTSSRSVEYDKVNAGTFGRGCIVAAAFNT